MPAEHIIKQTDKVTSTITCSGLMAEKDEFNALAKSGITMPINGNKAKILNKDNSFIWGNDIFGLRGKQPCK